MYNSTSERSIGARPNQWFFLLDAIERQDLADVVVVLQPRIFCLGPDATIRRLDPRPGPTGEGSATNVLGTPVEIPSSENVFITISDIAKDILSGGISDDLLKLPNPCWRPPRPELC